MGAGWRLRGRNCRSPPQGLGCSFYPPIIVNFWYSTWKRWSAEASGGGVSFIPQLVTILVGDRGVGDRADLPWQRRQFWPSSAAFEHLRPHSAILSARSCHMMPIFGDQTFRKKTTHRGRSRPVQSLIPQIYLDHLAEIAWMEPWKDII